MSRLINIQKIGRTSIKKILQAQGVSTNRQLVDKFYGEASWSGKLSSKLPEIHRHYAKEYNKSRTAPTKKKRRLQLVKYYTAVVKYKVTLKGEDGKIGRSFIRTTTFPITAGYKAISQNIKKAQGSIQANSPTSSVEIESQIIREVQPITATNTILTAPIKEAGAMNLDGFIKNEEWCLNRGLCVPDWLTKQYTQNRAFIKKFVKNDEVIEYYATHQFCDIVEKWIKVIDNEPNKEGYTIENIKLFCANCYLPVYILHNSKLIYHNRNAKEGHNKKGTPLVIEIRNNHLYPIIDTAKIKSIVQIPHSNCVNKKAYEAEAKDISGEVIYNTDYDDPIEYALDIQLKAHTQIYPKKLFLNGSKLSPFTLDGTTYISAPRDVEMELYLRKEHTTETPASIARNFMKDLPQSFLNHQTIDALYRDNVKNRTHIGLWSGIVSEEEEEDAKIFKEDEHFTIDIIKAYRYVMEQPMDDFMTIDFNSLVEVVEGYDGSRFGLWFIETSDLTLLHQSNWYSNKMIEEAVMNGIDFDVKYFIRGKKEKKTLLKDLIDEILKTDPDGEHKSVIKTIINSISGNLGRTENKLTKLMVNNDIERVWEDFFSKPRKWENNFIFREKDGLYCWGQQSHIELLTTNLPMYIQILDWSNILLHRYILKLGGYENLIYRKTDSITMRRTNIVLQPSTEIGGYRIEPLPEKATMFEDERYVEYDCRFYKYKKPANIKCSDDYAEVIKLLESGEGLMIDSRAGTGKTFMMKKVIDHFGEKAVARIAFTNKACNNIEGTTIHRFFAIDKQGKLSLEKMKKNMRNIKVVCIDEISMINQELWRHLYYLKRYYKHIPFLMCGEYRQLPPIENDPPRIKDGYFNHPTIRMMCDYNRVSLELTDKCRYDRVLFDYLTDIAEGVEVEIDFKVATISDYLNGANLVFTNKRRREINSVVNSYYAEQTDNKFQVDFVANPQVEDKYSQATIVYEGLPLLSIVNHRNSQDEVVIIKNQTYKVVEIDTANRRFKIDDDDTWYDADDINTTFIQAYAMTIHKCQGDTIEGGVNIHEHMSIIGDKKLHYTAVSRAKDISLVKYFV